MNEVNNKDNRSVMPVDFDSLDEADRREILNLIEFKKMMKERDRVSKDDSEEATSKENFKKAANWLINGETGISSECLCGALFGIKPDYVDIPHDYSDYRRCELFLNMFDVNTRKYIWQNVVKYSMKWEIISHRWSWMRQIYQKGDEGASELYRELRAIHDKIYKMNHAGK